MPQKPEFDAADATAESISQTNANEATQTKLHPKPPGAPPSHPGLAQALDLLACPACLGPLCSAMASLCCAACGRIYPVEDGIPILLVDRAIQPRTDPGQSSVPAAKQAQTQ